MRETHALITKELIFEQKKQQLECSNSESMAKAMGIYPQAPPGSDESFKTHQNLDV